jgi:phosphate binding protein
MQKRLVVLFAALIVASMVLAACGTPATPTEAPAATDAPKPTAEVKPTDVPAEEDPTAMYMPDAVSGDVVTAGSSTVFPLTERMAEVFKNEGFTGNITIDSIGTGAGFERFCKTGETDISNASRPIKSSEVESCAALATPRTPVEFRVGTDALAVAISKDNTFLTDITLEQLALAFSTAEKWSDIDPSWPAETILRYSPGTDSGTFDYFVEAVMAPANKNADGKADVALGEEAILSSTNIQFSEDDNVLVQGVEGSPYAIGYFGYAYFQENEGKLNALSVNGVAPTPETAENGEYPLARPLFIYSDANIMQSKPQVAAFIKFYLENVNNEILDVGYFPASDAALLKALNNWYEAVGLTMPDPFAMYMPDAVSGDVVTAGSSTVFPLTERMAEVFKNEGFTGNITIDSIGTGAGFERFCKTGETDISNASRPIKSSEVESCAALATPRTPVEFRVGTDALAVAISKDNTFLTDITLEQLALAFSTAEKWSDIDPSWPAETILRYSPGTDSGTFDYFVEAVMAPANKNADGKADVALGEEAILSSTNIQFSEDDNVLVQGVEGSPYAIGYFGYAYFQENEGKLNALSVNGVAPTPETAENGEYPLARPLFIYSDANIMQSKPQVAAFIKFYLENVNNEILDVGYFPASDAALQKAFDNWINAVK